MGLLCAILPCPLERRLRATTLFSFLISLAPLLGLFRFVLFAPYFLSDFPLLRYVLFAPDFLSIVALFLFHALFHFLIQSSPYTLPFSSTFYRSSASIRSSTVFPALRTFLSIFDSIRRSTFYPASSTCLSSFDSVCGSTSSPALSTFYPALTPSVEVPSVQH